MLPLSFMRSSSRRLHILDAGGDMKTGWIAVVVAVAALSSAAHADEALRRDAAALFGQIKTSAEAPSAAAELGRALFWDTRASADGKTACASCHFARDWGAD